MTAKLTIRTSEENYRWLRIAKMSGFSMSKIVHSMIDGHVEHGGVECQVTLLIERRVRHLRKLGRDYEATRLIDLVKSNGGWIDED